MKFVLLFTLLAGTALAQDQNACLATQGTIDNVVYSAAVHQAGLFPAFTDLKLTATDPSVVGFQIVVEFQDGSKQTPAAHGTDFLIVGDWCKIARVTINSLVVGSIHQIR